MSENTQTLVALDGLDPVALFTGGGLDELLARIRAETATLVPDVSTAAGRKAIGSMAHKVARSKTAIDDLGKALVEGWKKQAGSVDAARRKARDVLDALKDEVRAPLTDWEAEQARIEQEALEAQRLAREAEERRQREELERREAELREREAAVARAEAERQAREDAERQAREQAEREERIRIQAEERARREQADALQRAEREAAESAERARQAEARAAEQAAAAARQAEQAERERQEARERERLEAEERQRAADAARAADIEHRRKVNVTARDALVATGISVEQAQAVLTAIITGRIPAVAITY